MNDDTKIWRTIFSQDDIDCLQNDIHTLDLWAKNNLMKFHPDKCKVLIVHNTREIMHGENDNDVLSPYFLGDIPIISVGSEKDLGVDMTPKLKWDSQISRLCSSASQKLGMLRRNCFFVSDARRGKTLYLTLVRSLFEHCAVVWRPNNVTLMKKVETIQKKALKWVLNEEGISYSDNFVYYRKCKELNILPMKFRFDLCDLVMLHKVINCYVPLALPSYLTFFTGQSRLRFCNLDKLCLVSSVLPSTSASQKSTTNAFANSFFYRSHLLWNKLPIEIRMIDSAIKFKKTVKFQFLKNLSFPEETSDCE